MKFEKTAAHSDTFLQAWIGYWSKYSKVLFASVTLRSKKPALAESITALLQSIDKSLATAATRLRKVDEPTYNRMRLSHQQISKYALASVNVKGNRHREQLQRWYAEDASRAKTSSARMGGIGSMLAISLPTSQGTSYHYDD